MYAFYTFKAIAFASKARQNHPPKHMQNRFYAPRNAILIQRVPKPQFAATVENKSVEADKKNTTATTTTTTNNKNTQQPAAAAHFK